MEHSHTYDVIAKDKNSRMYGGFRSEEAKCEASSHTSSCVKKQFFF